MKHISSYSLYLLAVLTASVSNATAKAPAGVHVVKGKYGNYYHVKFTLTKDNVLSAKGSARPGEGGMFEVFVKKTAFPVAAPNCNKAIIIRMPWSDSSDPDGPRNIEKKQQLFHRIRNIAQQDVEVIIELNPYVKVRQQNPLSVELTACNVFFRHGRGHYIDHLDEN